MWLMTTVPPWEQQLMYAGDAWATSLLVIGIVAGIATARQLAQMIFADVAQRDVVLAGVATLATVVMMTGLGYRLAMISGGM